MKARNIKKIKSNIYYCCGPNDTNSKTIWHFRNYNLIMPNELDYNIDNYIDTDVKVDLRKLHNYIIIDKFIEFGNFYIDPESTIPDINVAIMKNSMSMYLNNSFSRLYENVEFTNRNFIVHIIDANDSRHKIRKLIIPFDLVNAVRGIGVVFSSFTKKLKINFHITADNIITLDVANNYDDIDIMDYDRVNKLIADDESRISYNQIFLLRI